MKKLTVFFVTILIVLFSGCDFVKKTSETGFQNFRTQLVDKLESKTQKANRTIGTKVVDFINGKNKTELKNLFCKNARASNLPLENQLDALLDYFKNGISEYEIKNGYEGKSVQDGKITNLERSLFIYLPNLEKCETKIYVFYEEINEPNASFEGLVAIVVYKGSNREQVVEVGLKSEAHLR